MHGLATIKKLNRPKAKKSEGIYATIGRCARLLGARLEFMEPDLAVDYMISGATRELKKSCLADFCTVSALASEVKRHHDRAKKMALCVEFVKTYDGED